VLGNYPQGSVFKLIDQIATDTAGKELFVHSPPSDNQSAEITFPKGLRDHFAHPERTGFDNGFNLIVADTRIVEFFACMGKETIDASVIRRFNGGFELRSVGIVEINRTKIRQSGSRVKKGQGDIGVASQHKSHMVYGSE
jgi:hypothetical protein